MCGIFAWAGKTPTKFSKGKLDILGIFNEERGKHSCGVATDGDIFIGIDSNKIYKDFLANSDYIPPNKYPVVIGHTRQATGGAHNLDNAHPFGFGEHNKHYHFIGVHNGTLHNHSDIAKEYDIEERETIKKNQVTTYRTKIDSEILLEAIFATKGFKVLEQYNGAAGLVFTNLEEPNVIYCYHGKSKKYELDKETKEERPLHYWQETRNSLYISSMPNSLQAIGAPQDKIKMFEHNIVFKITNGDVAKATKFIIKRGNQIQTARYDDYGNHTGHNEIPFANPKKECGFNANVASQETTADRRARYKRTKNIRPAQDSLPWKNEDFVNIYKDIPAKPQNEYGNQIYVNKMRYLRNGHLITGVYTWIPNFGFFYLGEAMKEASNRFYDFVNKNFYKDDFVRTIKDIPKDEHGKMFVPFPAKGTDIREPSMFFFYQGIRVRTLKDFEACVSMNPPFTLNAVSMCSTHPIMSITYKTKPYNEQGIIFDGVPYNDTFSMLGSEKVYKVKNGNCVDIQIIGEPDKERAENIEKIEGVVERLQAQEAAILKDELALPAKNALNEDLLDKDLDEIFKDSLKKLPSFVKRLEEYDSARAKKAKEILGDYLDAATKLMTIDINE